MRTDGERGEGKLGSIVTLAILGAILWAAWNVIPVYYANYSLADRLVELARVPKYNNSDDEIMRKIVGSAQELKLEDYVNPRTCKINTMDHRRTITCEYNRDAPILPGWKHTFHFVLSADQPLL